MKDNHPLKRKSIKPSSSTVRGMLPAPQFRSLDAAMQSLRSAGMRLDWQWKNKTIGWVCAAMLDTTVLCELQPTREPLYGVIELPAEVQKRALKSDKFPENYKKILKAPVEETAKHLIYEFPLDKTQFRDLLSNFLEALSPYFELSLTEDV